MSPCRAKDLRFTFYADWPPHHSHFKNVGDDCRLFRPKKPHKPNQREVDKLLSLDEAGDGFSLRVCWPRPQVAVTNMLEVDDVIKKFNPKRR